jgi:hypothetical protein
VTAREMNISQKFGFPVLFFFLLSLLALPPYFSALGLSVVTRWLVSFVLLSTLYLVASHRREFIIGAVLAVPTLGLNWTTEIFGLSGNFFIINLLHIVYFSYITACLLRYIFSTKQVTLDMIFAAMCTYLLVGVVWMFIYSCIELSLPGSFSMLGDAAYQAQLYQFLYYSFVTLSTLGYGDVTPLNDFAKSWVIIEAVIGQFYLAVVLARLVGLYISKREQ